MLVIFGVSKSGGCWARARTGTASATAARSSRGRARRQVIGIPPRDGSPSRTAPPELQGPERDGGGGDVAVPVARHRPHQEGLVGDRPEEAIRGVRRVAVRVPIVRGARVDGVRDLVRKIELGGDRLRAQASSTCSVNSATKFFGMSAFRLSTISSPAARFSSDAGASLFVSVMGSRSCGCPRRATGLDAPSTLLLANVLIAYSAKGACCSKSTEDTRVYPGMYLMPKSAMKLSLV